MCVCYNLQVTFKFFLLQIPFSCRKARAQDVCFYGWSWIKDTPHQLTPEKKRKAYHA